jgi:hypothetical protein
MISHKTVFVLGAGANVPYGFSTGIRLLEKARSSSIDDLMGNAARQIARSAGRAFSQALTDNMLPSIDAMLEHRRDLWLVGKKVMAALLYAEEHEAKPPADDDWMSLVFENMASDAATPSHFAQNPVTFVTFNYDRYLEYRFIRGLTARYAIDDRAAWEALEGMGFFHVHGSLGALPAQRAPQDSRPDTVVPLGAPETDDTYTLGLALQSAENSIRIVHDADPVGPAYEAARTALVAAAQVFFLGFGFGKQNVARLQTSNIQPVIPVYCTAYGMTDAEIRTFVRPAFPNHPPAGLLNSTSVVIERSPIRQCLRERIWSLR